MSSEISSKSLYALTSSPHNEDKPFYIGAVPRDVLIKIFSCLSLANLGAIAQVCKTWQRIIQDNFPSLRKLHLFSKLTNNKTVYTNPIIFHGNLAVSSATYYFLQGTALWALSDDIVVVANNYRLNNSFFYEIHSNFTFLKINDSSADKIETIEDVNATLCSTSQFAFVSEIAGLSEINDVIFEPKVICVSSQTGKVVFHLDLNEALKDTQTAKGDPLRDCLILQEEPLIFLTITKGGLVTKWQLSKNQPQWVETWHLFPAEKEKTTTVSEAFVMQSSHLLVRTKGEHDQLHLFALKGNEPMASINIPIPAGFLRKISDSAVILDNTHDFLCYSIKENKISLLWQRDRKSLSSYESAIPESKSLLHNEKAFLIFDTNNGNDIKTIPFPHDMYKRSKQFGNFLLIDKLEEKKLVLLDIKSERFSEHNVRSRQDDYILQDFVFLARKEKLLLLFRDRLEIVTLPTKDSIAKVETAPLLSSNSETKLENNPSLLPNRIPALEDRLLLPSNPIHHHPSHQKRTCQKVALVVLFLLFVASISLMLYFSFHRALNLSIGFGTSTLLTGLGASYLGWRERKYRSALA